MWKNYSFIYFYILYMHPLVINQIKKLYEKYRIKNPKGRKLKHSLDVYLELIDYVLTQNISWRCVCKIYRADFDHTTLQKVYMKLCDLHIFEKVYNRLIRKYRNAKLKNIGLNSYERLYMDSSMIKNVSGRECLGKNHFDRNRNATKVNVIMDNNNIPISHEIVSANIHDSRLTERTLNKIKKFHKNTYLMTDKGYINDKLKNKLRRRHISMIYPKRINQHNKNLSANHQLELKNRINVEHMFAHLKACKRLRNRYDHTIKAFHNFILLGFLYLCDSICDEFLS